MTHPVLIAYLPEPAAANRVAVIVCPGGGFRWLSIDHEGIEVARWLNSIGVTAFVLKYRLARTGDAGEADAAVMAERVENVIPLAAADGLQAMKIVRSCATEWGIAPDRIGILGFSAGGRVTVDVALHHDSASRPDFAAPIYAATPQDVKPPADAPPLFLVQADDDKTVPPVANSVRLYEAWKKAGFSSELHVYSQGGHGFGMSRKGLPVDTWTDRFRAWLEVQGLWKPTRASAAAK